MIEFRFKFHWSLFQPSTGLDNGLAPNRRQAIIWTNADPIHWRIYAALGEMSYYEFEVRLHKLHIDTIDAGVKTPNYQSFSVQHIQYMSKGHIHVQMFAICIVVFCHTYTK